MGASFLNLVTTKVTVKGEEQKFVSLRLHQRFNRHHAFTVIVNYLSPGNTFKQTPEKFINYIGETVSISFAHKQTGESYDFEGVVTQVEMVGSMGEAGGVAIHGASPTILYENNGTLDSWMDQTLSAIIKEATQEYGKVPLASNPILSATNAENQQIAKQTPSFTPKNVKSGVFVLFKIIQPLHNKRVAILKESDEKRLIFIYPFSLIFQDFTSS